MLNHARPNCFHLDVPGVGLFVFNRKNYGAQVKIDAVIARILGPNHGGDETDEVMRAHANIIALYSSLVVQCPPGWEDLEAIDLTEDPDKDREILNVHVALREKLDSFRVVKGDPRNGAAGHGDGAGQVQHDAVLGAAALQDPAHRPEVAGA